MRHSVSPLMGAKAAAARSQWVAGIGLFALACALYASPPGDADIDVRIEKRGPSIVVDVDLTVQATAVEAWGVMTDYDNMAKFISNLESSAIIGRDGNVLSVMQKGKASRGPLTFTFENVREIVLTPFREIHSRLISGDLEASEFITRVVDHGASAQIINHGEFIPKVWVPPIIGPALIQAETRKQFQELRMEILRRKGS